jgi:hypothetical protein
MTNTKIQVNTLLQYVITEGDYDSIERILWIDEKRVYCFTINIYDQKAVPILKTLEELNDDIDSGRAIVLEFDPLLRNIDSKELDSKNTIIRDKAWNIIEFLVKHDHEPEIYNPNKRGKLIQEAMIQYGVTHRTIYRYLRKYWQGGMHKDTLLPKYFRCGGLGIEKSASDKKRGRPNTMTYKEGKKVGVNVTDDIKKIIQISYKRYYCTEKELPLTEVYNEMKRNFFTQKYYINGEERRELIDKDSIPSFKQFKYWVNKDMRDARKEIISRRGEKRYNLDFRPILSNSLSEVFGPGSRFQIDATMADIYLVSRFDRESIIGRPIVYVCIDVFSRLVCGIYVGLEGPSWLGARMALLNTIENKVDYCRKYGIDITEDKWECSSLPNSILADRGEFEGSAPEGIIRLTGVSIENTSPYRGDLKGIVERYFRTTNEKIKHWAPGAVKKQYRERGERDYRLDAKLNIYEFTQIIINLVLYHNNSTWLDKYDRNEYMIQDKVDLIPSSLWRWGIENRSGKLKQHPKEFVNLCLLPTGNATVTRSGIKFKSMLYSSKIAMDENWFVDAAQKGSSNEKVSYDPRDTSVVYYWNKKTNRFEECYLLDKNSMYKDRTFEEIEDLSFEQKYLEDTNKEKLDQGIIDLNQNLDQIIKSAEMEVKDQNIKQSDRKRVKNIKANREREKEAIRRLENYNSDLPNISNNKIPIEDNETEKETNNIINLMKKFRGD